MGEKAQSSIEFISVVGFVFLIFMISLIVVWDKQRGAIEEKIFLDAKRVCDSIATNINTISEQGDGYYRYFSIPDKLYGGYDYNITIYPNISRVWIKWDTHSYSASIITANLEIIFIQKGEDKENCVINRGGKVYINSTCWS